MKFTIINLSISLFRLYLFFLDLQFSPQSIIEDEMLFFFDTLIYYDPDIYNQKSVETYYE